MMRHGGQRFDDNANRAAQVVSSRSEGATKLLDMPKDTLHKKRCSTRIVQRYVISDGVKVRQRRLGPKLLQPSPHALLRLRMCDSAAFLRSLFPSSDAFEERHATLKQLSASSPMSTRYALGRPCWVIRIGSRLRPSSSSNSVAGAEGGGDQFGAHRVILEYHFVPGKAN